ncbi:unnamed protein product [Urochloa humidicola]
MGVWSMWPVLYAGDSKSTWFSFFAFLCVVSRFLWGFLFAGCIHDTSFITGLATNDTAARDWRSVYPGGLGFRPPVLLSLLTSFSSCVGGGVSAEAGSVRFVYSYLEKSGWSFPAGVTSLLVDLESLAVLGAPDLRRLGDGFAGRSVIQAYIDFFDVPTAAKVGFKNQDVASLEASSSSWISASSCKFAVPFFYRGSDERRLRLPATRITGRVLQGRGCNFSSFRDVLVSCQCKLLYQ